MGKNGMMQIGEVAERTGLSLRTIRHYEELGLVVPAERTSGGFRLYTDADVERLHVVKRMKPLDFPLEQMRDLLDIVDQLAGQPRLSGVERARLTETLAGYAEAVRERRAALAAQLAKAEEFSAVLEHHLASLAATSPTTARR